MDERLKSKISNHFKQCGNVEKLFMFEQIPHDKLFNATKSYAQNIIEQDEVVILLYDDTFFGSAKNGFVLTNKRLYSKNILSEVNVADVSNIRDITVSGDLIVTTHHDSFNIQITQTVDDAGKRRLPKVVQGIVNMLKSSKTYDSTATKDKASKEIAKKFPRICKNCGAPLDPQTGVCEYCFTRY